MRLVALVVAAATLSACEKAPAPAAATAENATAAVAPAEPAPTPTPSETAALDFGNDQAAATAPATPADPACAEKGVMCAGPVMVRAENFNLFAKGAPYRDGARNLVAQGSLVLSAREASAIKFAILYQPITATLDNGAKLAVGNRGVTGVTLCGRDGAECLQGTPDRFQTLTPGESPARVSLTFAGRSEGSLAASLPTIATADVSLQIYVVGGDNIGRTLNIQLPQVPLRNQLKQ